MMKNTKLLIVEALGALVLTSYSSKYPITYNSTPEGTSAATTKISIISL